MQKKLLSALISLSVLSSAMPATFAAPAECESEKPAVYSDVSLMNIIDDGTCGDGITWTLDDAGTLTISGTGEMYHYNYRQSPFYRNENITSVVIEDGITSIGSYAFYSCTALTSVTLPDSIKSINDCAFFDCTKLENITLPDNITSIDGSAFYRTAYYNNGSNRKDGILYINDYLIDADPSITECEIESTCKLIASDAFYGCTKLTSITIPEGVTVIGDSAFYNCFALETAVLPKALTNINICAFYGCSALTDVYYAGTAEEWQAVSIQDSNEPLTNATMHYNGETPEPEPTPLPVIEAEITMTETETGYSFEVTPETASEGCSVYAAIYDENGALIGLAQVPLSTEGSTSVEVSGSENDSRARVFVWSDVLQPITAEKTFIL